MKRIFTRWIPLLLLLLLPLPALRAAEVVQESPAGTVRVSVDASKPQWQISRYLTGMHFVYAKERDALYRDPRIAQWMQRSRVGMMRWPGGAAVQTYHWDHLNGIAFKEDSWDPKYKTPPEPPEDYMDLDEYIAFCRRVGAEPLVGVNIGSGRKFNRLQDSLDEARRLIRYCKEKGYKVRHWYIGNECFKGWNPGSYAKAIDQYAEVLKSVDPDIVIIGDWKFGPEDKHRFEETLQIAKTSKQINVMEIHEKWGNEWGLSENNGEPTLENWQKEAGLYGGRLDSYIEKFLAEMKASGKNVRLGFNEWGAAVSGSAVEFPVALVKADYLISLFRHPVYSACDWNLNMGPSESRILETANGGHELTGFSPSAHVFELCASALEKQSIPMSSSDALVYGFSAKDPASGVVQVYLLNKHSDAATVELSMMGSAPRAARCEVTSFVHPGVLKAEPLSLSDEKPVVIHLAPLSFNRITITPPAHNENNGEIAPPRAVDSR